MPIRKCCFCGKEITEKWDYHNADPIVAPDENGFYEGCCSDCNERYVKPARRVLWPPVPYLSERERKKLDRLIPYVQRMSVDELREALESGDPLGAFLAFRKKRHKVRFYRTVL